METVDSDIILIYFVGTVGMLLLAGSLFFFFLTYQKRLLKKQLEINKIQSEQQEIILQNTISAQEKERKRIARDLHDEVGAMLSVVKLNINRIEKKSEQNDAKQLINETRNYIDEVILQVRRISRALLPPSLETLGLFAAVEELANWINKTGQVKVQCFSLGNPCRFDLQKELALFRIIQELVNNSLKHSGGDQIIILSRFRGNSVAFLISDNGKGFQINEMQQTGLGLKNLESRTKMIGAKIKIHSAPGKGTRAIIGLKLN